MDSDDDIYDDLPQETTTDYIVKIENELETVQQQYKDAQKLIEELSAEKYHLQKRIEELARKVADLERNISSLYKTAVAENKRKDNLLHELRVENDDLAFRRREHRDRSTNYHRNRSLDHGNSVRERYRNDGSPSEEKYRNRSRNATESALPIRGLIDKNGKYEEKHRIEKQNSSERNESHSNEFYDQERYHRSRTKSNEVKEKHSRSPRDRTDDIFDTKNGFETQSFAKERHSRRSRDRIENLFEVQTYSEHNAKMERRRSLERRPKSQIKSVTKKGYTINPKLRLEDASAPRNASEPQNSAISFEKKHFCDRNEHTDIKNGSKVQKYSEHVSRKEHRRSQETHVEHHINPVIRKENTDHSSIRLDRASAATNCPEPQSSAISTEDKLCDRVENILNVKNNTHELNTSNLYKRHRIEKTSSKKKDLSKEDNSNPHKRRRIENTSSKKNDLNKQRNLNLNKNHSIESTSNVKNGTNKPIILSLHENDQTANMSDVTTKSNVPSLHENDRSKFISRLKKDTNKPNIPSENDRTTISSNVKKDTNKPNIPILRENDRTEITSSVKNDSSKANISSQHKSDRTDQTAITLNVKKDTNKPNIPILRENDRTEITSSVKNDTSKLNISSQHKSDRTENTPSMKNDSNKPNMSSYSSSSNLDKNVQIQNTSHSKKDTNNISNPAGNDGIENSSSTENKSQPCISNPNENHHNEEIPHKTVDIPKNLVENVPNKFLLKTPGKTLIDDIIDQRNCKAAFLSMTKPPLFKLVTPMKDTPDLLKEKFTRIENNKIDAKIPMINEQRTLSPFKNVGIVEIVSRCVDEIEPTEQSKFETVTACSVTISEDVEHGVFSRKSRKRPRIQKIVTGVKKVATC